MAGQTNAIPTELGTENIGKLLKMPRQNFNDNCRRHKLTAKSIMLNAADWTMLKERLQKPNRWWISTPEDSGRLKTARNRRPKRPIPHVQSELGVPRNWTPCWEVMEMPRREPPKHLKALPQIPKKQTVNSAG